MFTITCNFKQLTAQRNVLYCIERSSLRYTPHEARSRSPKVHTPLGLYYIVTPNEAMLRLVQKLLGLHISMFVQCNSSERSEVRFSIEAHGMYQVEGTLRFGYK